jgi:hypothetical protein
MTQRKSNGEVGRERTNKVAQVRLIQACQDVRHWVINGMLSLAPSQLFVSIREAAESRRSRG